jgi:GAF domain-containing protein
MPRAWTRDDIRLLKILAGQRMSVLAIARKLNRTVAATQTKAARLGLKLPGGRGAEAGEGAP